jgi:hypothetical protein
MLHLPRLVIRAKRLDNKYDCKLAHFTKSFESSHYVTLTLAQISKLENNGFYNWTWAKK